MKKKTKILIGICVTLPAVNIVLMILRWIVLQLDHKTLTMLSTDNYSALDKMFDIAMFDLYYFFIYTIITWILTLITLYLIYKETIKDK